MNEAVFKQVQEVFKKVFKDETLNIETAYTAQDVAGWDSLTHMILVATLEESFSITFTFEEVTHFKNIGDMVDLISKKIG